MAQGLDVGSAFATFTIKTDGIDRAMKKVESSFTSVEKASNNMSSKIKNNFSKINKSVDNFGKSIEEKAGAIAGITAVGTAGFAGLALSMKNVISVGMDFDKMMSSVRAKTGATSDQFDLLRQKAKELGESTVFSASEVASSMDFLAMAGFDTEQILASVAGTLDLASAGALDLGTAADIASNILQGFNLSAEEMNRVSDVMAKTATSSNVNIVEMGESMKFVAPIASKLGISVEEASAAVGTLGNAGIKGTLAGTGLSQVLARLAADTGGARSELERLGVEVFDAEGNFLGLNKVMAGASIAFEELSQQQKIETAKTVAGQVGMKSFLGLISVGPDALDEFTKSLEESGGAGREMANVMTDNLFGAVKENESAIEAFKIRLSDQLAPTIRSIIERITELVRSLTVWTAEHPMLTQFIIVMIGAVTGLTVVVGGLALAIAGLTTVATAFGISILPLILIIGGIVIAIGLLVGAGMLLYKHWDKIKDFSIKVWNSIKNVFLSAWNSIVIFFTQKIPSFINSIGKWFAELPKHIGYAMGYSLSKIISFYVNAWNYLFVNIPKMIIAIGKWFAELPGKIWTSFKNTFIAIINWYTGMGSIIVQATPKIIEKIINFFKDLPSKMKDIGINIIKGLWDGMKSMWDKVTGWIGDLIKGFKKGFEEGLDIHSPSRVMAEIGEQVTAGLAVGMENKVDLVDNASDKVGNSINITNNNNNMSSEIDFGLLSQRMAFQISNSR